MQCVSAVWHVVRTWHGFLRCWGDHRRHSLATNSLIIIIILLAGLPALGTAKPNLLLGQVETRGSASIYLCGPLVVAWKVSQCPGGMMHGHNVELGLLCQRALAGVMLYLLGEGHNCVQCLAHLC